MDIIFGCGLKQIKKNINSRYICADIHTYVCGEYKVYFENSHEKITILHSLYPNTHENLWILQLIVQEIKARGIKDYNLVTPYLPYMRQENGTLAIQNMLKNMGFTSIHTLDIHDNSLLKVDNMVEYSGFDLLAQLTIAKQALLIAPDEGRKAAVERTAKQLDLEGLCLHKQRVAKNELIFSNTRQILPKKDCIICDDIVDSSLTMCELARELKENGAGNIWAFATHGVFSEGAFQRIEASELDRVLVTDSIDKDVSCSKIKRLTIAPLIEKILKNIVNQ
jgi:ribose-phosphate pyrophosphokinase